MSERTSGGDMTRDLSALAALRERLEKATGPDREIDAALWRALAAGSRYRQFGDVLMVNVLTESDPDWQYPGPYDVANNPPAYTASLDAALALVERALPGWGINFAIGPDSDPGCIAAVYHDEKSAGSDKHPTLALALCLALVRAREAQATEDAP